MSTVKLGDYVLATKYDDGDPGDHWVCGFLKGVLDRYDPPRYDVVDNDGDSFRGNGFRRVERITMWMGKQLLAMGERLSGESVWTVRDELSKTDPDPCSIGRMVGTDVYWLETIGWGANTTALLMRSTSGLKQKKLIADEKLEALVLSKEQVFELEFEEFIVSCRKMETEKP